MTIRILVLFAALLSVVLPACKATCELGNAIAQAGYAACQSKAGPLCQPPTPVDCSDSGNNQTTAADPEEDPSAITSAMPDVCSAGPPAGLDACQSCVWASCCSEAFTCFSEGTCTCLMGQRTPGVDWPADAPCSSTPDQDPAFGAFDTCLADHCVDACPGK